MTPEKYKNSVKKILQFIDKNDNYLLSGHINADGDAIASVIAFNLLLKKLNKNTVMLFHDSYLDKRFKYLAQYDKILYCNPDLDIKDIIPDGKVESAIILDVPSYSRLGNVKKWLPEKKSVLKIDHHPIEDVMSELEWVDEKASSTTALVYEIIEASGVKLDFDLAQAVFTGIVYDTGRFSFSNTTARDFEICSMMIQEGVKPSDITNRIFFENSFSALKIIGNGLSSMGNYLDGAVNVIYLDYEQMKNVDHGEIEELANYSVAIRGGDIGLFIREVEPGYHKISFRSRSRINVSKLAKKFNGGGHARAAACRVNGSKQKVIDMVVNEIARQLS